jgi:choline dehydrogenase-like flavoprotein
MAIREISSSMPTSLIIGSGPAAAGAAMALARDPKQKIIVLDIGGELEESRKHIRDLVASTPEAEWSPDLLGTISPRPGRARASALPEKRAYGSDFPFRNVGQLEGLRAVGEANPAVVSGAYGGFSNVWGAQIMPFSAATFDRWPISRGEMEQHYRTALDEMTLTGDDDDLSTLFPLLVAARPLPALAERTRNVLRRYEARRPYLQSLGITVGRARLAMRAESCTNCGLCMTGCPYGLIYSASHTFDRLRAEGRVTYRKGILALRLAEHDGIPQVEIRDLRSDRIEQLSGDRIFVACGGIGTTRLVLGSLQRFDEPVDLHESVQFVMPALSRRPTADPRQARDFTLNQFNLVYDDSGEGFDLAQIHFYPFNPVFESALPFPLGYAPLGQVATAMLRRLTVGLGYVPSWASPRVRVTVRARPQGELPELVVDREQASGWPSMLRRLAVALTRAAPALDLWPILPAVSVSPAAKSYHFGGSFPHSESRSGLRTDRLGRLDRWERIHLVDASVFPNVPATTFTLTIMANAHRIVAEVLGAAG